MVLPGSTHDLTATRDHGIATLEKWRILRKAGCSPSRLIAIIQAILTLCRQAG